MNPGMQNPENLNLQYQELTCDPKLAPAWQDRVERWYQLDACAYALCEAGFQLQRQYQWRRPDLILLSSAGGSNATDLAFAQGGASSPAKFVHTLPNIRGSSLCQVLDWSGPILCLQNGEHTLSSGLLEAIAFLSTRSCVWVLANDAVETKVTCLSLHHAHDEFEILESDPLTYWITARLETSQARVGGDQTLRNWLKNKSQEDKLFSLTPNLQIHYSQRNIF